MKIFKLIVFYTFYIYSSASAQKFSFPQGASFQIGLTTSTTELDIPIVLNANVTDTPGLRTSKISFQDPLNTIDVSIIATSISRDTFGNLNLHVVINNNPPLCHGKYNLILQDTKLKPGVKIETYAFDLTVKPAIIQQPGAVRASFVDGRPSFKPLTIIETSHNTWLNPITIEEISLDDPRGMPLAKKVHFKTEGITVDAGANETITYDIDGSDFPIGTSTGQYRIRAPQLSDPIPFTLHITKRSGYWVIFVVTLVGLIVGFVTRYLLMERKELEESRYKAAELIRIIELQLKIRPDEILRSDIQKAIDELSEALTLKKKTEIDSKVKTVRETTETKIKKFDDDNKALQDKIISFKNSLEKAWSLPENIFSVVRKANENTTFALEKSNHNYLFIANSGLQAAKAELVNNLKVETRKYKLGVLTAIDTIGNSLFKINGLHSQIKPELDSISTSINDFAVDQIDDKSENIEKLLQSITDQRNKLRDWMAHALRCVVAMLDEVSNVLLRGNINVQDGFKEKIGYLNSRLNPNANINSPEEVLLIIQDELNKLQQWLKSKLIDEPLNLSVPQKQAILKELNDGNYKAAADLLVQQNQITHARIQNIPANQFIGNNIPYVNIHYINGILSANGLTVARMSNSNSGTNAIDIMLMATERRIFHINIIQNTIAALSILVVAYLLFAEKFTGTLNDIFEIFAWALALDVTLNTTLTEQAGQVPKKLRP